VCLKSRRKKKKKKTLTGAPDVNDFIYGVSSKLSFGVMCMLSKLKSRALGQETNSCMAQKNMHSHYCELFTCRDGFAIFGRIVQLFPDCFCTIFVVVVVDR